MDGRRNCDWHDVVDISPFLRYESTGDSDQVNTADLSMDHADVKNYEADDALSCCSDSYDNTTFNTSYHCDHEEERAQHSKKSFKKDECYATCLKNKSKKKEQDLWYSNPNCRTCNDDGDDDEDGGSINQVWSSCGNIAYVASSQQKKKKKKKKKSSKSNALDGSSMEPKVENDKLFWDTCLDN